MKHRFE